MWSACLSEGEFRIASSYGVGNTCAVKHAAAAAVVVVVAAVVVVVSVVILGSAGGKVKVFPLTCAQGLLLLLELLPQVVLRTVVTMRKRRRGYQCT